MLLAEIRTNEPVGVDRVVIVEPEIRTAARYASANTSRLPVTVIPKKIEQFPGLVFQELKTLYPVPDGPFWGVRIDVRRGGTLTGGPPFFVRAVHAESLVGRGV